MDPEEFADSPDPADLPPWPVTGLAQDARGCLWIGCEHGPMLFDGSFGWEPPGLASLRGCSHHRFCFTARRTVWIGAPGSGLAQVDTGKAGPHLVRRLTTTHGLPDNTIRALCADARGRLWAGTPDGIAVLEHEHVVHHVGGNSGLPAPHVNALCTDPDGRMWVGTDRELLVLDAGEPSPGASRRGSLDTGAVQCLHRDARGSIWLGLADGGVCRAEIDPRGGLHMTRALQCDAQVLAMCGDEQGRLWVGTRAGAYVLDDGTLCDVVSTADGLPSACITALLCDRDGCVWAGTPMGLAILHGSQRIARALSDGSARDRRVVWTFAGDGHGRLFLGTESGLGAIDCGSERTVTLEALPEALMQTAVGCAVFGQDGHLWVGTRRQGLLGLDPSSGALYADLLVDRAATVFALCPVGEHDLWAATARHGLLRIDLRTLDVSGEITIGDGLPEAYLASLAGDRDGMLWAGTASGQLVCVDPLQCTVLHVVSLSGDETPRLVEDVTCDAEGMLWACIGGSGVACVDPRQAVVVRRIAMGGGLRGDAAYSCRSDPQGCVWLGTSHGISRLNAKSGQCVTIDQSMGLPHRECVGGSLHLDGRGRLWVGTIKGVGIVDTGLIPDDVPPSEVFLTAFRVLGEECELTEDLQIEDTAYDLQFEYGAVCFSGPMLVLYRVQLQGLEESWSSPTTQRSRRYTNLRPGLYVFRVSACNWGGNWSAPLEVTFRVVRNARAQQLEEALEHIDREVYRATAARAEELDRQLAATRLEAERARLAAEEVARLRSNFVAAVSHELRTPLTAIVGYAELLQAHWARMEDAARLDRLNRIVAAANRQQRLVEDLLLVTRLELGAFDSRRAPVTIAGAVDRAVDEVRAIYRRQRIDLDGPADMVALADPDRVVQILLNVIDNAAKYSPEESPIDVVWRAEGPLVAVRVRDRGCGIAAEGREHLFKPFGRVQSGPIRSGRVGTGLGLFVSRSLAQAASGDLALECTGPGGTVFRLTLPLANLPAAG